jgi:small subunit ribosomal protein S1
MAETKPELNHSNSISEQESEYPRVVKEELSEDEMMRLYEESMKNIEEGNIVSGKVVKLDDKEVVVDIGLKSEGIISIGEFKNAEDLKPGDSVDVFLEEAEDQDGFAVLSKQKADFLKVWDEIKESYDTQGAVEGIVSRRVKGGLIVNLFGVDAFLPGSQIDLRPVKDMERLIGETLRMRIIKLNWKRRNIVVSRRVILQEEREQKRRELLDSLEEDQVRKGVVKNITDFGAFVDLGGVDGLLHITDMSWGRVVHPSEMVAIGDEIEVKVIGVDREKERVSLGLKQLTPYPWDNIEEKYPVESRVRGKVVSITDYGAFVELEKGVEGLVHISEMSWTQHIRHPSQILAIGDMIEAVVLNVNKENERISLGIKQTCPDPWLTLDQRYPVGSTITGRVRTLTNFGAFIELEEGIDGLLHVSDMSWVRRVAHPSEIVKKGERVEVKILNIDMKQRRISLGLKQLVEDPLQSFMSDYPVGSSIEGVVKQILDQGVVVGLPMELEGFVPFSQLRREEGKKLPEQYHGDDVLCLKVIEINPRSRRIVLSEKAWREDEERAEIDAYLRRQRSGPTQIQEALEQTLQDEKAPNSVSDPKLPEQATEANEEQ